MVTGAAEVSRDLRDIKDMGVLRKWRHGGH